MNRTHLLAALLLPSFCAATSPEAQAWIDQELLPGTQALAMGGALTALAEDWTASWYNPAALAMLKRTEFNLGFEAGAADETRAVSTDGAEGNEGVSWSHLSHAGYAHPLPVLRGGLCWSAGWARLADFSQRGSFPDRDWRVTHDAQGRLDALLLSVAGQLTANLAAGGTLALHTGRLERVASEEDLVEGNVWRGYDEADLDGASLRLGLLAHQGPFRAGLTLEPPHTLNVDWSHHEQEGDLATNSLPTARGGASYGLRVPLLVSLGAGWRMRFWQAGLSWDWQDWSALRYEDLPAGMGLVLSDQLLSQAFQGRQRLRAGGEWTVPRTDLRLRAGAWLESSPRSSARITDWDEEDNAFQFWNYRTERRRVGLSGGLSWLMQEAVALDLSVARESWELSWLEFGQEEVQSVVRQQLSRWRVQLAISYRI